MNSENSPPPIDYLDTFMPMAQKKDSQADAQVVRWQLETDELCQRIELMLSNEVFEQDMQSGEIKRFKKGNPLMNERGVQEVLTLIRPHTDKNTILSNLTDFEIGLTMVELRSKLAIMLGRRYNDFEIVKSKLPIIVSIIINPIWATYKRAANETTLSYLGKTQQIQEIRRTDPENKTGFIDRIMSPLKR